MAFRILVQRADKVRQHYKVKDKSGYKWRGHYYVRKSTRRGTRAKIRQRVSIVKGGMTVTPQTVRIGQTTLTQHSKAGKAPTIKVYLNIPFNKAKGINYKEMCSLEHQLTQREMDQIRRGNVSELKRKLIEEFAHKVYTETRAHRTRKRSHGVGKPAGVKFRRNVYLGKWFDSSKKQRERLIRKIKIEGINVDELFRVDVHPRKRKIVDKDRRWELEFPTNFPKNMFEQAVVLANRGVVGSYYDLLKKGVIVEKDQKRRLARKHSVSEATSRIWIWLLKKGFKAVR
jgi:hypothetical protein